MDPATRRDLRRNRAKPSAAIHQPRVFFDLPISRPPGFRRQDALGKAEQAPASGRYGPPDAPAGTLHLRRSGFEPSPTSPEQFREFIRAESTKFARIIAEAGITLEQ